MKLVKILPALAVFAAAGIVTEGCDSPAGAGAGDEAVSGVTSTPVHESAVGTIAGSAAAAKRMKVKFNVKNGGYCGLLKSEGIVSTQDDNYLVYEKGVCAIDYTITITVPASDEYLNIRWRGFDFLRESTYVKAKMKAESGTITLDYNGIGYVVTKNLYDVRLPCFSGGTERYEDWDNAKKNAVHN